MKEHELIATYFAPLAGEGGLGLIDDAALFYPSAGCELVITADALISGVHFFQNDPPVSIAHKALGVNLSDLCAKAASPRGFVMALALTGSEDAAWLSAFSQGLGALVKQSGCALLGGDTVRTTGPLMISITAFGEVKTGGMVRRSGAKVGDLIAVSGTIGDAAIGLQLRLQQHNPAFALLKADERAFLHDRYLHPQPRLALTETLSHYATAAMDISDGLIGDAQRLLQASQKGAHISLDKVPYSAAIQRLMAQNIHWRDKALTGGDDYEILFTFSPQNRDVFEHVAQQHGIPITVIGHITDDTFLTCTDEEGREVAFSTPAYSHF
jgi:thiamine-monophosphate kinase